jgi:hypothetical protein
VNLETSNAARGEVNGGRSSKIALQNYPNYLMLSGFNFALFWVEMTPTGVDLIEMRE